MEDLEKARRRTSADMDGVLAGVDWVRDDNNDNPAAAAAATVMKSSSSTPFSLACPLRSKPPAITINKQT